MAQHLTSAREEVRSNPSLHPTRFDLRSPRAGELELQGLPQIFNRRCVFIVLEVIAAYFDTARKEKRTVHAVGDGTFIVNGRKLDRKKMMSSKFSSGVQNYFSRGNRGSQYIAYRCLNR